MAQQPSSSSTPPILVPVTPNQQQSKQQQSQPVTAASSSSSKPTKKIPPLPWTHLETVNLIEVYQEKWYSLKRGQLKASQWDQVAITVASRCGFEQPSKTSTQCRHKMEKLRKRYRSEKQRLSSSWAYFVLMDHMEKGPFPLSVRPISSVQPNRRNLDPPPPPPPPPIVDEEEEEDDDDDDDDDEEDEEDDNDNLPDSTNKSRSINHILRRPPIVNRIVEKPKPASSSSFAPRQCSSRVDDVDLGVSRFSRNPNFPKRKFPFQIDEEDEENDEEEGGVGGGGVGGGGGGGEPLMELASVIRSFGEGFVKIEQMKMEMMKETERYRMEMETKRTEMILESQHRIVDAIAKVLCSQKKAKKMQEM